MVLRDADGRGRAAGHLDVHRRGGGLQLDVVVVVHRDLLRHRRPHHLAAQVSGLQCLTGGRLDGDGFTTTDQLRGQLLYGNSGYYLRLKQGTCLLNLVNSQT